MSSCFTEMWNYDSRVGLLLLFLSICYWNQLSCCPDLDLHCCEAAVSVDSSCMVLRYTASQLLKLKRNFYLTNDIYTICGDAGILRRKRYIHRSFQGAVLHICHLMLSPIPHVFVNLKGCCTDLLGLTITTCLCLYKKRSLGHFLSPRAC